MQASLCQVGLLFLYCTHIAAWVHLSRGRTVCFMELLVNLMQVACLNVAALDALCWCHVAVLICCTL